jgi:DNA-directed RNA polymerase specialized sigma24 family protein
MRGIPASEYYDVAALGYLSAVVRYDTNAKLRQRNRFSTIAYVKMRDALCADRIRRNRLKRRGETVSLDALNGVAAAPDSAMTAFETEQLLCEMSKWLSPREMDVIRLRMRGYSPWEISRKLKMHPTAVHSAISGARSTVLAVCA